MKTCRSCAAPKPLSKFQNRRGIKDGLDTWCKSCRRAEYSIRAKRYFDEDPARRQARTAYNKELSGAEYRARLSAQGGVCAICKRKPRPGENRFSRDHCHKSNQQRGLLCQDCNYGLGCFKDDVTRLKAAITYLEVHRSA